MGSRKITESLAGENLEGLQPRALNQEGGGGGGGEKDVF
jgi:hypothetical protein